MSPELLALTCDEEENMSPTNNINNAAFWSTSPRNRSKELSGLGREYTNVESETPYTAIPLSGKKTRAAARPHDETLQARARISTTVVYGSDGPQPYAEEPEPRACAMSHTSQPEGSSSLSFEDNGTGEADQAVDDIIPLHQRVLAHLLREFDHPVSLSTKSRKCNNVKRIKAVMSGMCVSEVRLLCQRVKRVLAQEPTLLGLQAPTKVFGDLHGQLSDLLRYFRLYGNPSRGKNGDIGLTNYLFLGDYVDRGKYSVDLVLLLFSLKLEYPQSVYLLRGNHELERVNYNMGFFHECVYKFGEQDGSLIWREVNDVFRWMSLGAVVNDRIFCCHGGIGATVRTLEDIGSLSKPIEFMSYLPSDHSHKRVGRKMSEKENKVLIDLLWSDPAENETVQGCHENLMRGSGVARFGADVVKRFCRHNNLDMIIRGHECVMDGFTQFASGHLITVFSATNYCGSSSNRGAILQIEKDLVITPKVIDPVQTAIEEPMSPPTPFHSTGSSPFSSDVSVELEEASAYKAPKRSNDLCAQALWVPCRVDEKSVQASSENDCTSICARPPALKRIKTTT